MIKLRAYIGDMGQQSRRFKSPQNVSTLCKVKSCIQKGSLQQVREKHSLKYGGVERVAEWSKVLKLREQINIRSQIRPLALEKRLG